MYAEKMTDLSEFVEVSFDLPLRQTFTYRLPESLHGRAIPGMRVRVPWSRESRVGVVIGPTTAVPAQEIKTIAEFLDDSPLTTPEVVRLCRWIAEYYFCSVGMTIRAATAAVWSHLPRMVVYPAAQRWEKSATELRRLPKAARDVLAMFAGEKGIPEAKIVELLGFARSRKMLQRLAAENWIERRQVTRPVPVPTDAMILGVAEQTTNHLPQEFLEIFSAAGPAGISRKEVAARAGISQQKLAVMMREGILKWRLAAAPADIEYDQAGLDAKLTAEQKQAIKQLLSFSASGKVKPTLLFGVTGSGKTRVYLEVARYLLKRKQRVLVLVPEIALARTAASLWSAVFPGRVALWHSGLNSSRRYWLYRKIAAGDFDIVVGARSAVFAPLDNLGLIVVDEEHADSYKQSEPDPRYHARDAAVVRAGLHNCLCVLGSATPAVETFQNARRGKYQLSELRRRVPGRQLPLVHLVDLRGPRTTVEAKSDAIFTKLLTKNLRETIAKKQQVILFLNRRGHSTMVCCSGCGWRLECPHCGITLTYHLTDRTYRCHLCQFRKNADSVCPQCGSFKFGFRGAGTQKIEEQLGQINPDWRVDRLDADTAGSEAQTGQVLSRFAQGKTDILVGTQMVAKGLDFPRVGLVGVVWADRQLSFPDFRAEEKMFQLVTQVAGRSGRGKGEGTVVVQTFHPQHPLIELAAAQDYVGFFEREITRRRELNYPPFSRLLRLEFSSPQEESAYQASRRAIREISENLQKLPDGTNVLGPAPAPIMRVRSRYRWRLLLKTRSITALMKNLATLFDEFERRCRKEDDLRLTVDVDPIDFL